jgi:uncharacterized SAM-binding protein YcdF (DUF218 family)
VRSLALATAVLMVASLVAWVDRAFLTPALAPPRPSDAVLVLGGAGNRIEVAARLVADGYGPTLVESVDGPYSPCLHPALVGDAPIICFTPSPVSTQGEAEAFARIARSHHWTSVVVVSGHAQARRARLRVERCFPGRISVVPARAPASEANRLWTVTYEIFATLKAEVWQRGC